METRRSTGHGAVAARARTIGIVLAGVLIAFAAVPAASMAKSKTFKLHSGTITIAFTSKVYAILTKSSSLGSVFSTMNTVSPVAPATSPKKASYSFPITSGKLTSKTFAGKIASKGGLNFTSTSTNPLGGGTNQFELTTFALHLGGSQQQLTVTFAGANTNTGQPLATLGTKNAKHSKHGSKFTLSNVTLKLTSTGVQIMNGVSGSWTVGETLGTASVGGKS